MSNEIRLVSMNYKGKPLYKLSEAQLVALVEALAAELRMVGSTVPPDIKIDDIEDLLPMMEEEWYPPHINAMLYKGVGKAGGK